MSLRPKIAPQCSRSQFGCLRYTQNPNSDNLKLLFHPLHISESLELLEPLEPLELLESLGPLEPPELLESLKPLELLEPLEPLKFSESLEPLELLEVLERLESLESLEQAGMRICHLIHGIGMGCNNLGVASRLPVKAPIRVFPCIDFSVQSITFPGTPTCTMSSRSHGSSGRLGRNSFGIPN